MIPELLLAIVLILVGHAIHFAYRLSAIALRNLAVSNPYRQELAWETILDTAKKSALSATMMSLLFASVVGLTELGLAVLQFSLHLDRTEATERMLRMFVVALALLVLHIGAIGVWFKVTMGLQARQPAQGADEDTLFV